MVDDTCLATLGIVIDPTWDPTIEMAPENGQFVNSQLS